MSVQWHPTPSPQVVDLGLVSSQFLQPFLTREGLCLDCCEIRSEFDGCTSALRIMLRDKASNATAFDCRYFTGASIAEALRRALERAADALLDPASLAPFRAALTAEMQPLFADKRFTL